MSNHNYAQKMHAVDIFATGTWNGDKYTQKDLDDMVAAFIGSGLKPPLKLGHDENQKWWGQKDGAPALGWVERLYRDGDKLYADFAEVPDVVVDLIKQGRYANKSAEIYWNYESAGMNWPRALRAVSLLGADVPAVNSLQDLKTALMSNQSRSVSYADGDNTPKNYVYGGNMDGEKEKKYTDEIADLKSQLTKMEERAVKAEAEVAASEEKHAVASFTAKIDELVKAGKVLPAEKEGLIRTFSALTPGTKKYNDKEFSPREDFIKGLEARAKVVSFKDQASGGDDGQHTGDVPPALQIDKLVRGYMAEKNCVYAVALEHIKAANPELWSSYIRPKKKEG